MAMYHPSANGWRLLIQTVRVCSHRQRYRVSVGPKGASWADYPFVRQLRDVQQRLEAIGQLYKGAVVHQSHHLHLVRSPLLHMNTIDINNTPFDGQMQCLVQLSPEKSCFGLMRLRVCP